MQNKVTKAQKLLKKILFELCNYTIYRYKLRAKK